MRRTNVPPCWRAKSQLNSAVRALPTWKYPVGDGANRTRGACNRLTRSTIEIAPVGQPLTASRSLSRSDSGGCSSST